MRTDMKTSQCLSCVLAERVGKNRNIECSYEPQGEDSAFSESWKIISSRLPVLHQLTIASLKVDENGRFHLGEGILLPVLHCQHYKKEGE